MPASHQLTVGVPFYVSTVGHINDKKGDVLIDEDFWIGTGAIILSNCHIGRGAVVAAGAVVTKDVPPYAVMAGVPARIIASKFSSEQIMNHERNLYPPAERIRREDVDELFLNIYKDRPSIGVSSMNDEELLNFEDFISKKQIKLYKNIA